MKRALLGMALLLGSTQAAVAGPYLGLAVGPSPALDSSAPGVEATGRAARLLGGYRFGRIGAEASVTASDMAWGNQPPDYDGRQYMLAGKYNLPLGDGFEAFGKVGILSTTVASDRESWSDTGFLIGAGFEYKLKVPIAPISVFVHYELSRTDFEQDDWDLTSRQWMLGFTLGI
ncbi:MAG: outer membrane beta-barrel protein [Deltaproteobacteria bacterium]|nr:outer membrane beta-barrel protein [Deltaproteobacteria bacterium]